MLSPSVTASWLDVGRPNAPAYPCVLEARRARGPEDGRRDWGQRRARADSRYDGREEARGRLEGQGALHTVRARVEHDSSRALVRGVLARLGSSAQAEARARAAGARAARAAGARARADGSLGRADLEKGQDSQRRGNPPAHRRAKLEHVGDPLGP